MKFLFDLLAWLFGSRRTPQEIVREQVALPLSLTWPGGKRRHPSIRLTIRQGYSSKKQPKYITKLLKSEVSTRTSSVPYLFANHDADRRHFHDLSLDGDDSRLMSRELPVFRTPQQLADWLGIRVGELAWLVHRGTSDRRPPDEQRSHYVYHWAKKRSVSIEAGAPMSCPVLTQWRLIEAPKQTLKAVQRKILTEILEKVPAHSAAHGFVRGRSIVSNARPHVGQAVIIKLDLQNFYPNVTYSRVVAIFRSIGYCREAAIWLARLTTSAVPWSLSVPDGDEGTKSLYVRRHLPQGAPTSPTIANLSAFGLDVRLSGLIKKFGGNYTRYADDLTISGNDDFRYALRCVIPLTEQIVRSERFSLNHRKRKVIRRGRRQLVTGVVVNQKTNIRRDEFDLLKAILNNCVKLGPSTQNRDAHEDFAAHLRGRIAFVGQLNQARGEKLLRLFEQIDWER
ncbi:MAG: reverse transcriptase family protein [Planctomycetia bacterium]|nr:reverse transcriptase family protein [Planctomycetia bacterium]